MIQRISFALVNDRARYTPLVKRDGLMDACEAIQKLEEAFAGICADEGGPTEA